MTAFGKFITDRVVSDPKFNPTLAPLTFPLTFLL